MAVNLPTDPMSAKFSSVGSIISALLPYAMVLAGLLMLIMLVWGGITLMTAAGDPGKSKEGYGKIQAGIIGFVIVFVSYFVAQIVQVVLGVKFLQ
jgi:hypothetical protein